jgi:hemerythrin-like domain-containing protein
MSIVRIGSRPPPTFDDPVGVLGACHRRIEDRLATLERALAALPAPEARAALADVMRYFDGAGVRHTEDEEQSVFPRLERTPLLADLEADHRAAEAIYLSFRMLATQDPPPPEIATHAEALCRAYRAHIQREEAQLFPLARALAPEELRAIGIEMRLRRGGGEP